MGRSAVSMRAASWKEVERFGLPVNSDLPELDDDVTLRRTKSEIENRLLCMLAIGAAAYGFPKSQAIAWLKGEHLWDELADVERKFLVASVGDSRAFKEQIEGMWALVWSLGLTPALDYSRSCPKTFVSMLPQLDRGDSSSGLRRETTLRGGADIRAAVDLAYCLHWAVRQGELDGGHEKPPVPPYVIRERRRALEWLASDSDWYQLELDT